ncbi:uncharacterized protein LOC142481545 isoform X2 [Ascaphus truei]|uniref:uncharacterized protein LOC142481545 isoform X2 n=1 Tax=Ascaphus truei TaxID=8439 RepID=UPI003F599F27
MGVSQCLFFDSLCFDAAWQTTPFGSRLRIVPVYVPSGSLRPRHSSRSLHTSPTPDLGNGNNHSSGKTVSASILAIHPIWPGTILYHNLDTSLALSVCVFIPATSVLGTGLVCGLLRRNIMTNPQDADQAELRQAISTLIQQNQAMADQIVALTCQMAKLSALVPEAPVPLSPPQAAEPVRPSSQDVKIPPPKPYAGNPQECRGFLNQCEVQFEVAPLQYDTSRKKVAYMYNLLTGSALAWASPVWELRPNLTRDYLAFKGEFRQVFYSPARREMASVSLLQITQRRRSVTQYAVEFHTLAAETNWGQEPLVSIFWQGLSESIKDELARQPRPDQLETASFAAAGTGASRANAIRGATDPESTTTTPLRRRTLFLLWIP